MKYVITALVVIVLAMAAAMGCRIISLQNDLQKERTAHCQTKNELAQEMAKSEALAGNARRCLAREAAAQANAAERSAILSSAAEKERPPQEKEKVADDATRNAVINRLNRGLRH